MCCHVAAKHIRGIIKSSMFQLRIEGSMGGLQAEMDTISK